MADAFDPYRTLQVDPEADEEVIKAAYRGLARKYHPDLTTAADAAIRMAAINAAWELIGEPDARRMYDRSRAIRTHPAEPVRSAAPQSAAKAPPPEEVSRDWTSGRSSAGGGYDPSMRAADGFGAAGPPPGRPSGSVLNFGRYAGWSLGEISRTDLEYIEWLDRTPIGRPYRDEIDQILRKAGRRTSEAAEQRERRGLYRRR